MKQKQLYLVGVKWISKSKPRSLGKKYSNLKQLTP